jgi:hypothetical protein
MRVDWLTHSYEDVRTFTPPEIVSTSPSSISPKSHPNTSQAVRHKRSDATGESSPSKTLPNVDSILQKIQDRGIDSLSQLEREWLVTTSSDQQRNHTANTT